MTGIAERRHVTFGENLVCFFFPWALAVVSCHRGVTQRDYRGSMVRLYIPSPREPFRVGEGKREEAQSQGAKRKGL